jgi:hypothetical protein
MFGKFHITYEDGTPVDPDGRYFVLRLDGPNHEADRRALLTYAQQQIKNNPELATDLFKLVGMLEAGGKYDYEDPWDVNQEFVRMAQAYMQLDSAICVALSLPYPSSSTSDMLDEIARLRTQPGDDPSRGFEVLKHQDEFIADVRSAVTERLQVGEKKYGPRFLGKPIEHAWEEVLDLLYYIWIYRHTSSGNNTGAGFTAPKEWGE